MRAFFIMVYPHHVSQIYCEGLDCSPHGGKSPDRFISFDEAVKKGWERTIDNRLNGGWICPECKSSIDAGVRFMMDTSFGGE